jgi:hypothetical protein
LVTPRSLLELEPLNFLKVEVGDSLGFAGGRLI